MKRKLRSKCRTAKKKNKKQQKNIKYPPKAHRSSNLKPPSSPPTDIPHTETIVQTVVCFICYIRCRRFSSPSALPPASMQTQPRTKSQKNQNPPDHSHRRCHHRHHCHYRRGHNSATPNRIASHRMATHCIGTITNAACIASRRVGSNIHFFVFFFFFLLGF
ncbi:hypothetical protein EX30DRAFT_131483 [Ascodesmis nigricans]|uniref:Uncharacterized protein n=1 Tax=Ascodesmis nigricans TaxID=341454 RepID=A0A4S2MSH3_9PEZI|nr:hypothetical protein EX30DRAFT_131483 [Ascodesmis nigricans]